MTTTKIELKNQPTLIYVGGESFVGLDSASGGYPYETNIRSAHHFSTPADAAQYIGANGISQYLNSKQTPEIVKLVALEVEFGQPVQAHIDAAYHEELAELKRKYNK